MSKQTSVEWLQECLQLHLTHEQQMQYEGLFHQAIEMEKQQIEKKDNIIGEIDNELAMIEDYTHGEVGNIVTNLRYKIQQYHKITYGK